MIDGGQYWELGWFSGPFRLDDHGDLWYRQNERTRETVERFLNRLDDNPLLRSSELYQKSWLFSDLSVELEDVLVVEFDGPVADVESPTADLDMEVFHQYVWELQWALPMGIWKLAEPAPNQRSFAFMCCGIEWSASILLERGLGVVQMTSASALTTTGSTDTKLIWARIGGREYGRHPGEGYPGYPTSIEDASWGEIKRRSLMLR